MYYQDKMIEKINLKELRIQKGYTQEEVAKKLGVKQQQYSLLELGKRRIFLDTFLKLMSIYNYEIKLNKKWRIEIRINSFYFVKFTK